MKREATSYTVGQVAELTGVTVRTLHHYDEIGLLAPHERTNAGYRVYTDADLERLNRILLYRELGFTLEETAAILDDRNAEARSHLERQLRLLHDRIARTELMIAAVERELEAEMTGHRLTPEERFELWGDFDPEEHAEEAQQRWGDSPAFQESQRRVARYGAEEWRAIKEESEGITTRLAQAMRSGEASDGEVAMGLAEEHRQHIGRWFYECGYEMHVGLGDMYVTDERFAANYEKVAEGLAAYFRDAIRANASRNTS